MSERDVITLLAAANPVRVDDLASMDIPTLGRHSSSRLVLAIAAAALFAGAAALIGFFAVPDTSPQPPATTTGGKELIPAPHALVPLNQALSEASKSFGAPVVLPDTALLKPSDADPTAYLQWWPSSLPSPEPGVQDPVSKLDVRFSSAGLIIEYTPTAIASCGDASCSTIYPNALDQWKAAIYPGSPARQIIYLSDGTPALITTSQTANDLLFRLGPLQINIWDPPSNDGTASTVATPTTISAADLQTLAQSIVDRSK